MAQADQSGDAGNASSGAPSVAVEAAGGYLLAGLLIFGGIGVWLDRWLDMNSMTPVGIVVGFLLGGYLVYLRVVRVPHEVNDEVLNGKSSGVAEGDCR
jgi:F0F1-type ATP synthase assembly protein I